MRWILIYLAERLAGDPARFASALRSTPLDDAADVVGRETSPSIKLVRGCPGRRRKRLFRSHVATAGALEPSSSRQRAALE